MQKRSINCVNSNYDWVNQEIKGRTKVIRRHKKCNKKRISEYIRSLLF